MRKYCFDLESATEFAKANNTFNSPEIRGWDKDSEKKLQMFNIEGYSRVVRAFCFVEFYDAKTNKKYWSYEGYSFVIQIIETGQCLVARDIRNNSGKYFFFLLNPQYHERDRGFKFDEQEPNYIGKANQKKLQQWVDYLNRKDIARLEYANTALQANIDFASKFKAKYPTGKYNTQADGWTSEFRIEVGAFYFKYIAYDDGRFGRDVDFIYSKLPSNEDLLK